MKTTSKNRLCMYLSLLFFMLTWLCLPAAGEAARDLAPLKQELEQNLYQQTEPEPLTLVQCGQCHTSHFQALKQNGGRHQFQCRHCHEKFHAYNPQRGNWDELMPKCASCHTLPHGETVTDCLTCHQNPHTPRQVPMNATLLQSCPTCHPGPADQLQTFPSAHTEQGCDACHQKHGYIPNCMDCHEPHVAGQEMAVCLGCHQVHKPLQIGLTEDTDAQTCGTCHEQVYNTWSTTPSKHGQVNCGRCHTAHGKIPECTNCHGQPHDAGLHAKFPRCLDCHLDAHNPPVKQ